MEISYELTNRILGITYETLPKEVVDKVKLCILHSVSCAFAGREERWTMAARAVTKKLQPLGKTSVWFSRQKSNAADAAFVNAVSAQSILYEDIHRQSNAHPGLIAVPVALSLGEELGAGGKKIIESVAAGYEMMGVVGLGTACDEFGRRGFRPTSIAGIFGSSAVSSHLLGLSTAQRIAALGLAGSFASGINQWAAEGTEDLYFQNGMAARNGVMAALLAGEGVTAPARILEGKFGASAAFGLSLKNLERGREDGYVVMDVLFKPAPACALVQTTAQLALSAKAAGADASQIESAVISTFHLGKTYAGCDNKGPFNTVLQARMSNQFNFAATLVHGEIANSNYYDFQNQEIARLAARIRVEEDDAYTKLFPKRQPVGVTLKMRDGRAIKFYKEEPVYLDKDGVINKFYEHCGTALGQKQADIITDAVFHLERFHDISKFLQLFFSSRSS